MGRHLTRLVALGAIASLVSACSGGGGGGTGGGGGGGGHTIPTPQPSPLYVNCAQSGSNPSSAHRQVIASAPVTARRIMPFHEGPQSVGDESYVAVTYESGAANSPDVTQRESATGARFVNSLDFSHLGLTVHVLAVPTSQLSTVESQLRSDPGVQSVGPAGGRRYVTSVSHAYFPNDPYYDGFSVTVADPAEDGGSATPPPATYEVPPYEERADVPGQWADHAVCLGDAFEYSQSGNGSSVQNANALGSSSVTIALIDTGVDTTHPDLPSGTKVINCYRYSSGNGTETSCGNDEWGHGTDTAAIAAAEMGNGVGFVGAGGNVKIYEYQVFPNPDSSCFGGGSGDSSCSASTADIAAAINDAVSRHVNVISMSLGGNPCPDSTDEATAVANAISANVVVVAASGNGSSGRVDTPACDSGVIAVGATGMADGKPNGAGNSNGSAASPYEYVASYSNYGSPGASAGSASAWGIVAPGGDPSGDTDADDLHWIEDAWTSTPYGGSGGNDAGTCTGDYPTDTGTTDCRIDIAGTSMATPMVAGAAALIISVNAAYQSPSAMKALLCSTADDIRDPHEGCGRLNIYRAMATALSDPTLP